MGTDTGAAFGSEANHCGGGWAIVARPAPVAEIGGAAEGSQLQRLVQLSPAPQALS